MRASMGTEPMMPRTPLQLKLNFAECITKAIREEQQTISIDQVRREIVYKLMQEAGMHTKRRVACIPRFPRSSPGAKHDRRKIRRSLCKAYVNPTKRPEPNDDQIP